MSIPQFIRPSEIKWKDQPALPVGAKFAVLHGDPSKTGEYVLRVRVPKGIKVMPHSHPENRIYTVVSGTFGLGLGDTFDTTKLQVYPQGSVIYLPAGVSHFQYSESEEYIIQINAIGPTATVYVKSSDDPRRSVASGPRK
ncbi:MAG: cupin domain-containing protein [Nitrososphaerales archaeon]